MSTVTTPLPAAKLSEAEFFQGVVEAAAGRIDPRLLPGRRAAASGLNTGIDSEGGFLCPSSFTDRVLQKAYNTGEILRRCTELQSDKGRVITPSVNESDRSNGSRFGGATVYRVEEAGSITASQPDVASQLRKLNKLACLVYATSELTEDYPQLLPDFLEPIFSRELAYRAEDDAVAGSGAGQALGLLNANCKIRVSKQTNQTAATVWGKNISDMVARFWGPSWRTGAWLANQEIVPELTRLADVGAWGSANTEIDVAPLDQFQWGRPGEFPTLCGMPLIPNEYCSALGTEGDIMLVDLTQYAIALRQQFAVSAHVEFLTDQQAFRFVWSFDGMPTWASAITPDNGSDTLSPIVTLETRS